MNDNRVTFGSKAAKRIGDVVRRVEGTPFGESDQRRAPVLWNPGTVRAIVTTAITQCSGTTPGSGAADIYRRQSDGTMAMTENVNVANWSTTSGTIAIGKHIKISWCEGEWDLSARDC